MLVLDGVVKSYDEFSLGPIDLDVGGEVLCVLGPSGCGKTTLLSVIAGTVAPDAGTITLDGTALAGLAPEERGAVLVFQDGALFPHMTARENVSYAATSTERVTDLAEALEIVDVLDRRANTLSGGERQRVALARSLAADPDCLLLDEPLANLDTPIKRRLRTELRPLLSSLGIPVIYVTHDQHEATAIGDRLAVVEDGTVHQLGSPEAVFARPATPFVASFTGSTNRFDARVVGTERGLVLDWEGVVIETSTSDHDVGAVVCFCIRSEYVEVTRDENRSAERRTNVLAGTVRRHTFEGDRHVLSVAPDELDAGIGTETEIEATLSPPAYDRLGVTAGDSVTLVLPSEAIHVLDEAGRR